MSDYTDLIPPPKDTIDSMDDIINYISDDSLWEFVLSIGSTGCLLLIIGVVYAFLTRGEK